MPLDYAIRGTSADLNAERFIVDYLRPLVALIELAARGIGRRRRGRRGRRVVVMFGVALQVRRAGALARRRRAGSVVQLVLVGLGTRVRARDGATEDAARARRQVRLRLRQQIGLLRPMKTPLTRAARNENKRKQRARTAFSTHVDACLFALLHGRRS